MAEGSGAERVVCCVDARVHEIYHAAFSRMAASTRTGETKGLLNGAWEVVNEPSLCAPAAAPELPGEGWLGCGSGFKAYGEVLAQRYAGKLSGIDLELYPHARDIAHLAAPRFAAGLGVSAEEAVPVYLREKVALRIDERANR
jgi:tRNA threonylcarbamoyladenosine biosynthesis protein TsaB